MYRLDDADVVDHLGSLPSTALVAYAEIRATLEVAPWSGKSSSTSNPDGAVRVLPFTCADGSGFVYYLVLERERRVDVLELVWLAR